MKYFVSEDSSLGPTVVAESPEQAAEIARQRKLVSRKAALLVSWDVAFEPDGKSFWFARTREIPGAVAPVATAPKEAAPPAKPQKGQAREAPAKSKKQPVAA